MLPKSLKKNLRVLQRSCQDFFEKKKYAIQTYSSFEGKVQKEMEIVIREGKFYENKIHNLKLVAEKINGLIINPKEFFSFWKIVGEATSERGFKEGRNLISGEISSDIGGGICQYSSLFYYFILNIAGLKIIERHPHSMDIYKENERFVPLGADATVSFGFKDFQFQNKLSFPIQLKTEVREKSLFIELLAKNELCLQQLEFNYNEIENGVFVTTNLDNKTVTKNFYKRL